MSVPFDTAHKQLLVISVCTCRRWPEYPTSPLPCHRRLLFRVCFFCFSSANISVSIEKTYRVMVLKEVNFFFGCSSSMALKRVSLVCFCFPFFLLRYEKRINFHVDEALALLTHIFDGRRAYIYIQIQWLYIFFTQSLFCSRFFFNFILNWTAQNCVKLILLLASIDTHTPSNESEITNFIFLPNTVVFFSYLFLSCSLPLFGFRSALICAAYCCNLEILHNLELPIKRPTSYPLCMYHRHTSSGHTRKSTLSQLATALSSAHCIQYFTIWNKIIMKRERRKKSRNCLIFPLKIKCSNSLIWQHKIRSNERWRKKNQIYV